MPIASAKATEKKKNVLLTNPPTTTPVSKEARFNATFRRSKLEAGFVSFCQMLFHSTSFEPLPGQTKRVLSLDIDYITNPQFDSTKSESEFLGDVLLGTGLEEVIKPRSARLNDLPSHLARLCETRLFSPAEEKLVFQRMNYLRHRAKKAQSKINPKLATLEQLHRVEGLLAAADWYRDLIVKSNMRLVISIVKKFVNVNNIFDDLLSDGIVALMRAVDKFDYDRGFRFSTYATQVVRRNAYRNVMQKQKEKSKVTTSIHEAGIDVSDEQTDPSISIDRWNDLRNRLGVMLDHLDRREKLIVRARFSLGSHRRVQTLQRLADKLGVSKERVRQLEKRALDKLRGMVTDEPMPELDV